jgi:hypothetical protein
MMSVGPDEPAYSGDDGEKRGQVEPLKTVAPPVPPPPSSPNSPTGPDLQPGGSQGTPEAADA